jgi:hypothetical protein
MVMAVGALKPAKAPPAPVHCPMYASLPGRTLDAVADGVGHEQPAGGVDREAARRGQLAGAAG